ncbi:SDR family NAD(P)-dependent oxidoreductase, partial [Mediterraneibacter faecis]|uniref:SDR family NAD(P)-dependent oxidoreductase n=1 Tax=Mediterraneibacter faecis TaxID=592978 RepID=UPI001D09940A
MTLAAPPSPSVIELAGPPPRHRPAGRLAGKICLVVGATSGIGRATALRMAEEGAGAVVVSGRRQALGQELGEALRRTGSESLFVTADVTCERDLA